MPLISSRDLQRIRHPHYVVNFLLASSFLCLKFIPPFCSYLFNVCHLEHVKNDVLSFKILWALKFFILSSLARYWNSFLHHHHHYVQNSKARKHHLFTVFLLGLYVYEAWKHLALFQCWPSVRHRLHLSMSRFD